MKSSVASSRRRRILILDDHPIVRRGLAQLIRQEPDLDVCAEAGTAPETMRAIVDTKPDLVILDISLVGANGIEVTKTIRSDYPKLPVLVLSMHDEEVYAERALRAGAKGYVMKQETPEKVLAAIRTILRGGLFLSETMSARLLQDFVDDRRRPQSDGDMHRLSDRELEIFELIGGGQSTRHIAQRLGVSIKTVETHRANIKQKLKLKSSAELTHRAILWSRHEGIT
jgi:DNA-binding NarL/FixJ family response regulator